MPCGFNSNTNLFWLGHSKDPRPHLSELLNKNYACYIGGCDFDRVMIEIARGTDCWPPKILENSPSHVLQQLVPLPDFPVGVDSGVAVLGDLRRRLKEAASVWQDETPAEGRTEEAFLAGEDIDADIDPSSLSAEARSVLAWRFVEQGNAHFAEAEVLIGSERLAKLAEASDKYGTALKIKPDMHEALNNWGGVLLDQCAELDGAARQEGLKSAEEKLLRAKELSGRPSYNLACLFAVSDQVDTALDELEACEKLPPYHAGARPTWKKTPIWMPCGIIQGSRPCLNGRHKRLCRCCDPLPPEPSRTQHKRRSGVGEPRPVAVVQHCFLLKAGWLTGPGSHCVWPGRWRRSKQRLGSPISGQTLRMRQKVWHGLSAEWRADPAFSRNQTPPAFAGGAFTAGALLDQARGCLGT